MPTIKAVKNLWKLNFDGASRGNPGPAAYGWLLRDYVGSLIAIGAGCIGHNTSDLAEAEGLLRGIDACLHLRPKRGKTIVEGDSQTIINALKGGKTKNAVLRPKIEQARECIRLYSHVDFQHVKRCANKPADKLANWALDNKLENELTLCAEEVKKREDLRRLMDLIHEDCDFTR